MTLCEVTSLARASCHDVYNYRPAYRVYLAPYYIAGKPTASTHFTDRRIVTVATVACKGQRSA